MRSSESWLVCKQVEGDRAVSTSPHESNQRATCRPIANIVAFSSGRWGGRRSGERVHPAPGGAYNRLLFLAPTADTGRHERARAFSREWRCIMSEETAG